MTDMHDVPNHARLSADDLVPDEPLRGAGRNPIADGDDLLHHRVIARKVAELATSANGKVNIALFGPWGAGKSSFNELLKEELASIDQKVRHITFDAWKNAGEGFRTNFLSELARQIPNADRRVSDQLFQATTKVTLPFVSAFRNDHGGRTFFGLTATLLLTLFILFPLLWTVLGNAFDPVDDFMAQWWSNITGWAGIAVSSTLLLVVSAGLVELSKVTVSKSTPSHVAQFNVLFDKLLNTDSGSRYVIFIDELDRCGKDDVMATLEGLRTFLGHDRCVFVVAFDRDAIATTIAEQMQHSVPSQSVSPYYRTSGEYLDKIFQFQMALPPQPAHTFRRYALSLVRERGGVWAQLRAHQDGLLDRVITVLSPMHLASPRRTKVLLNDFAVSARVFESLDFDWLGRAEEIAVLTVIQTEFPNLMADIERAPSLMRLLYRQETPSRPEVLALLHRYLVPTVATDGDDDARMELDRVVRTDGSDTVARELQVNLERYLRRLREMGAPEPRADLIMMHSDGNLLHFDDPGVYHDVLLAADTPRQDVVEALSLASPGDRALAIDHILEQAEPESTQIALSLRVLAGELAAALPVISPITASNLHAGMFAGLSEHTQTSIEGYARAIAVSYSEESSSRVLEAAAAHSEAALGAVIGRFAEELAPADWASARPVILSKALENAADLPSAAAAVLRRTGEGVDAELGASYIAMLADSLSISKPEEVEPATTTAAARQEAEEQNEQLFAEFEEQRDELRMAAETILEIWPQLPVDGGVRRDLLTVLRATKDDSTWHLDKHDQLIADDIVAGDIQTANSHLLTSIAEQPYHAAARWRKLLSNEVPVDAHEKAHALNVVVTRATMAMDVAVRTNGADNALRISALPSEKVPAAELLAKVAASIDHAWDEYTDDRFEYQSKLLAAIDQLDDGDCSTTPHRTRLYVDAVSSAQTEDASVEQIVKSVKRLSPAEASSIAQGLMDARLWEDDYPELSTSVLLTAQEVALSGGEPIVTLPAGSIAQVTDSATRKQLADAWLRTVPPTAELKSMVSAANFSVAAWQVFGERASTEQRAEAWELLIKAGATVSALRAVSATGQPLHVYESAAAQVRDAASKTRRESAIDRFLALPSNIQAAGIVQALVRAMADERKRTELPLGLRLVRAYGTYWSKGTISGLKPQFTRWVELGEAYVARRDLDWLTSAGYIARKSSIWDSVFGRRNR